MKSEKIKTIKLRKIPQSITKTGTSILSLIPYKKILYFALGLNVLTIALTILLARLLPPEVPLFYGAAEGVNQLAASTNLVLPATFSVSILIVNTVISLFIENEFLKKSLILTGLGVTFFSTITTIKIFLLVGPV